MTCHTFPKAVYVGMADYMADYEGKSCLRKSGSGRITIDFGAGESVWHIDMVPEEPLHDIAKYGARYRVAGCQSVTNKGEKMYKFRSGKQLAELNSQAIEEVKKPLASAAKIANKGNIIVLDGDGCDSYIYNNTSKQKILIYQGNSVYVMGVNFMVEADDTQAPFRRQA